MKGHETDIPVSTNVVTWPVPAMAVVSLHGIGYGTCFADTVLAIMICVHECVSCVRAH